MTNIHCLRGEQDDRVLVAVQRQCLLQTENRVSSYFTSHVQIEVLRKIMDFRQRGLSGGNDRFVFQYFQGVF